MRGLIGSLLEEKPRWIAVANRSQLDDDGGVLVRTEDLEPRRALLNEGYTVQQLRDAVTAPPSRPTDAADHP